MYFDMSCMGAGLSTKASLNIHWTVKQCLLHVSSKAQIGATDEERRKKQNTCVVGLQESRKQEMTQRAHHPVNGLPAFSLSGKPYQAEPSCFFITGSSVLAWRFKSLGLRDNYDHGSAPHPSMNGGHTESPPINPKLQCCVCRACSTALLVVDA